MTNDDTSTTAASEDGAISGENIRTRLLSSDALSGDEQELWLDRGVRYLGIGRIARRISPDLLPSYVYTPVAVIGWTLVSAGADVFVFRTTPIYLTNPYFLLQPLALIGSIYGAHSLYRSYLDAIGEMQLTQRSSNPEQFVNVVPSWLPWALFIIAVGMQLTRIYTNFANFSTMDIVANGFVFPFVYAPILVQFFAVYVTIELIVPLRLYQSDVGIHFLDPHGVGGLRPVGELVKKAYYYVVAGLVAYALITYAPGVGGWDISATAGLIFTLVWIVSVATVAFAFLLLHRFLHREKRNELQQLEAELRNHITNPWEVREYTIREDAVEEVEDLRQRIDEVSSTREYPANINIWTQLLIRVVSS